MTPTDPSVSKQHRCVRCYETFDCEHTPLSSKSAFDTLREVYGGDGERARRACALEPESLSVGQLNQAVRDLREENYQLRIRLQDARAPEHRDTAELLKQIHQHLQGYHDDTIKTRVGLAFCAEIRALLNWNGNPRDVAPPTFSHSGDTSPVPQRERITSAAIRKPDGSFRSLPIPASHYAVAQKMQEAVPSSTPLKWEQGFATNRGRFVDRVEAKRIAEAAGQIVNPISGSDSLFSEELWTPAPSDTQHSSTRMECGWCEQFFDPKDAALHESGQCKFAPSDTQPSSSVPPYPLGECPIDGENCPYPNDPNGHLSPSSVERSANETRLEAFFSWWDANKHRGRHEPVSLANAAWIAAIEWHTASRSTSLPIEKIALRIANRIDKECMRLGRPAGVYVGRAAELIADELRSHFTDVPAQKNEGE